MYIIVEIQKNGNVASVITNTFTSRESAESDYHQKLMYAAVSAVEVHTVIMHTVEGDYIKSESYTHIPTTEE